MQQLYGLQVDFIHLHGHFMVVSAAEGLKAEMLSGLQLTMMTMNRIPRLLEMQTEEKDGEIKLFYNVTGKRMLTHRLRSEKLTLLRFYSLLLEIADVLDDSKIYMLQPGRYILKEDFIYCGNGLEELYFTYIPKEQLDNKSSVSMDLQHLASRWIHRVDVLQGNGFQELMSYLQEENFNIPELKQLLLKHIRILGHGLDQPLSSGEQIGFAEKDDFPQGKDAIPLKEPGMQELRSMLCSKRRTPLHIQRHPLLQVRRLRLWIWALNRISVQSGIRRLSVCPLCSVAAFCGSGIWMSLGP